MSASTVVDVTVLTVLMARLEQYGFALIHSPDALAQAGSNRVERAAMLGALAVGMTQEELEDSDWRAAIIAVRYYGTLNLTDLPVEISPRALQALAFAKVVLNQADSDTTSLAGKTVMPWRTSWMTHC